MGVKDKFVVGGLNNSVQIKRSTLQTQDHIALGMLKFSTIKYQYVFLHCNCT